MRSSQGELGHLPWSGWRRKHCLELHGVGEGAEHMGLSTWVAGWLQTSSVTGALISSFCLLFAIQRPRGSRDQGWSLSRSQSCRHDECRDLDPQLLLQTLASQAAVEMHLGTEGQANPLGAGQQIPGAGSLSFLIARLCDSSCRFTN